MDWFHGGRQFACVHNLFPSVPRYNLRKLRDEILLPFCDKHELRYNMMTFFECNKLVIESLSNTADGVSDYVAHGFHGVSIS